MTDTTHPRILIGASIPRSGHHFLADLMTGYFGRDLYYCETYTPANCCKSVPCAKRGDFRYIYQKSHDRDFKLPPDIAEALYLIQYRHPVPEALSDRELDIKDRLGRPSLNYRRTRAGFTTWLAAKAVYYRKFHDKWLAKKLPNAIYLDYAQFIARPDAMMREIVTRSGMELDEARLVQVVEKNGGRLGGAQEDGVAYKPRVNTESPFYDAELLGALEDFVLKRCPAYGFSRELSGSYEESELYGMILLRDMNEPLPKGETKRFKVASRYAPEHPEVLRRLALRTIRDGHVAKGIGRLEDLVSRHPYFAGGYETLFEACADSATPVPESVLTGNALVACSESAELLAALGAAFEEKGLAVNAVTAFSLAATLDPQNDAVREQLAGALAAAGK
jgi:hypothetical protein